MGKLITREELGFMASWYFSDTYYRESKYGYEWPSPDFPYRLHIHYDVFKRQKSLRPKIRRWIENSITDTVIADTVDHTYRKVFVKRLEVRIWDSTFEISNMWQRFSFENEHTASQFTLVFSDVIQPITRYHPDYPDDAELNNTGINYEKISNH